MADPGIQRSTFIVKHFGTIDFSINQKTAVQESLKVSVFSRQDFDLMKPQSRKFTFTGLGYKATLIKLLLLNLSSLMVSTLDF